MITALPTPPSRQDPSNFSARADAFLGALPQFVTEANALESEYEAAAAASATAAANAVLDSKLDDVNPSYTGTLTGGTGVVNLGSGQFYKDAAGNVGVGTASPAGRVHSEVSGAEALVFGSATRRLYGRADSGGVSLFTGAAQTGTGWYFDAANNKLIAYTNSAAVGQFDAAGNLGLGVTPSAWASGRKVLQVSAGTGGAFLVSGSAQQATLGMNAYSDGATYRYTTTGTSSIYDQGGGVHYWYTAPSGTAGNPISFTQAMTLDAGCNLGLGVTPSAWGSGIPALQTGNGFSYSSVGYARNAYFDGSVYRYIATGAATQYQLNSNGGHYWYTAPSGTAGNPISFTQAMTLDASGNLLVGVTSADVGKVYVRRDSTTLPVMQLQNEAASGQMVTYRTNGNSQVGSITFTAAGVSYNTSSDARLKENIEPANDAASLIDAIQVRKYDWKSDGSHQRYGMVAQELDAVFPEAVSKPEDPDQMMGVDYSKLVPLMLKEIQSLRERVQQLENN